MARPDPAGGFPLLDDDRAALVDQPVHPVGQPRVAGGERHIIEGDRRSRPQPATVAPARSAFSNFLGPSKNSDPILSRKAAPT